MIIAISTLRPPDVMYDIVHVFDLAQTAKAEHLRLSGENVPNMG
jgi:hypothetical protein